MSAQPQTTASAWLAELSLRYEYRAPRTVITARQHQGPLSVQKPFYPEGDVCHSYILHPPGGVVGGDILRLNISVEDKAHALITTPASAKFYRSNEKIAQQQNQLHINGSGILEWLPQETILFADSKVNTVTHVALSAAAKFCGWEIICLGRPASREQYHLGYCQQQIRLEREGIPLLIDRTVLDAHSPMLHARWGLAGQTVTGMMLMTHADKAILQQARAVIETLTDLCAATLLDDVLVCRYLGQHGIQARETFSKIWSALRPAWIGRTAHEPRIWST